MGEKAAIVLAAGKSMRMKSSLPKVMHPVCGLPMLSFVISACRMAGVDRIIVVVGHGKEHVENAFGAEPNVQCVEQAEQGGTGHAVLCCRDALHAARGSVLVIAGDMPLVRRVTLANLVETRERRGDALAMATTVLDDPSGYGRIVRDSTGSLERIVEHADCNDEQRCIQEVNPSFYCIDAKRLFEGLEQVKVNPATGECYLTDIVGVLRSSGLGVSAEVSISAEEGMGINSRVDLAAVSRIMQDRIQLALMNDGVTIVDPDNTWIEAEATVGRDSVIHPFTSIGAGARIGEGCRIGPLVSISAGEAIADGAVVGATACTGAGA